MNDQAKSEHHPSQPVAAATLSVDGQFMAIFAGVTVISIVCMAVNIAIYTFVPWGFSWSYYVATFFGGAAAAVSYNAAIYLVYSRTWWLWRIAIGATVVMGVKLIDFWWRTELWGDDGLYLMFFTWFLDNLVMWSAAVALLWLCKYALGWRMKARQFPDERRRLAIWHILAFTLVAAVLLMLIRYRITLASNEFSETIELIIFAVIWVGGSLSVVVTALWTLLRWRNLALALLMAALTPTAVAMISCGVSIVTYSDFFADPEMFLSICFSWLGYTILVWAYVLLLRSSGRRMIAGNLQS